MKLVEFNSSLLRSLTNITFLAPYDIHLIFFPNDVVSVQIFLDSVLMV